jgi:hypothetical protein
MLQSNRRGTLVLYFIMAVAILTVIFSGAISPPLGAALLTIYLAFVVLTSRASALQNLRRTMPERTARIPQITRAAREAAGRIPRSSMSILQELYTLQDIGLIIDERRRDGLHLRHARFMSLDDESLRRYVVLQYPADGYPEKVILRFEINDAAGEPQFIYEMEHTLRPGENLIVPDYRLVLKGNSKITNAGTWDLQVSINGMPVGIHNFNILPPLAERLREGSDGEVSPSARLMVDEDEEELPVSLEELLDQQGRR